MKKISLLNIVVVVVCVIVLGVAGFGYSQVSSDKILKNTYINDIEVGGLTKEQALEKISKEFNMGTIELTYQGQE